MALVESVLLPPRPGPGVCETCFNLTDGYERCYSCVHGQDVLDAAVPISYSVAGERLHRALFGYKRLPAPLSGRLRFELATLLRRFLELHERCVAHAAGTGAFALVTTVPSGERHRDDEHPLRGIVTAALGSFARRHQRLLRRSAFESGTREYDFLKYLAVRPLDGEPVLLIDDTWTTGASAQSAAAALKAAGAGRVAAIAIGRHLNREWHDNDRRLVALREGFEWSRCALCAHRALGAGARLGDGRGDTIPPRFPVAGKENVGIDRLDRVE